MNQLEELLTHRVLSFKQIRRNDLLTDMVLDDPDHQAQLAPQLRNVCAKLSVPLSEELDQICDLLDISKRRFIEVALVQALSEAKRIMAELDMLDEDQEGK